MFKPHTIDQFKVMEYIKQTFVMSRVLVSPDSRTSLKVQDEIGDSIVFGFCDGRVTEVDERLNLPQEERRAFVKKFHADPGRPALNCLEDIVRWWHEADRPISLQQALNLPDDLYLHYLKHEILDDEEVRQLAATGLVTEEQYMAMRLWYHNGNFADHWLGPVGVDGSGDSYEVTFGYHTPQEVSLKFYLLNEYYREMHKGEDFEN